MRGIMQIRVYILAVSVLALLAAPIAAGATADPDPVREYQIKAAFLYNFIRFVDWPRNKITDANDTITIGIVGKDPFGKAFEPILKKKIKGKQLTIEYFPQIGKYTEQYNSGRQKQDYEDKYGDSLKRCHLLFISPSEKKHVDRIIELVKDFPVLTVGETDGLLEAGAVIRFIKESKKVRFEINADAAELAKLKIRSQLLRLAKRVIKRKKSGDAAK